MTRVTNGNGKSKGKVKAKTRKQRLDDKIRAYLKAKEVVEKCEAEGDEEHPFMLEVKPMIGKFERQILELVIEQWKVNQEKANKAKKAVDKK